MILFLRYHLLRYHILKEDDILKKESCMDDNKLFI